MKTHRASLSQNSNTLSQLSCDTQNSYYSDSPESEHNVSVSSIPENILTTPSPGLPYRLNDVFYADYEAHQRAESLKDGMSDWGSQDNPNNIVINVEGPEEEEVSHHDPQSRVKLPGEPLKAVVSLVFLGVSWIANTSSLALTHEFMPDYGPLPDIVLDNITYQPWALDVCEILLMISLVAAIIVVVFHAHRFILLRRIFFLLGLLYFYRSVTIFVTVLPKSDPNYKCSEKAGNITALLVVNRVIQILSGGGLSINGKHVYCGDYIFSGHTVVFVMAYLCIKQYTPERYYPVHWVSLLTSITGVVFLLLARGHYTVDIILAYGLTYWLWITYHTLANFPCLKQKHKDNQLSGLVWWYVLRWFEANVHGAVPNEFSVPMFGLAKKCWRRCRTRGESEDQEEER